MGDEEDGAMNMRMLICFTGRTGLLGLAAALLAGAAAAAGGAARPTSGFLQYDQTTTVVTPPRPPLKMVEKLWFKGPNYRREDISPTSKVVILSGPSGTFVILPGGNGAMKMSGPPSTPKPGRVLLSPAPAIPGLMYPTAALVPRFAKRVGTETVGRYRAQLYESRGHTPALNGRPPQETVVRYWVSPPLPVPVKIVTKASPGTATVSVLRTAQFNTPVPDTLFRLPKGMKVHAAPTPRPLPVTAAGEKGPKKTRQR